MVGGEGQNFKMRQLDPTWRGVRVGLARLGMRRARWEFKMFQRPAQISRNHPFERHNSSRLGRQTSVKHFRTVEQIELPDGIWLQVLISLTLWTQNIRVAPTAQCQEERLLATIGICFSNTAGSRLFKIIRP